MSSISPTRPRARHHATPAKSASSLSSLYSLQANASLLSSPDNRPFPVRKTSLSARSVAHADERGLGRDLGVVSNWANMPQTHAMPGHGALDDLDIGELVDVPGNMHGTVKFIGAVQGRKGTYAGVELSREFAAKGKNNGEVDGVHYFATTITGAGIFLPISKALRRGSPSSHEDSFPVTPSTPSFSAKHPAVNYTPPTPSNKFSQSVGPGAVRNTPKPATRRPSLPRPASPLRRESLSRPESPVRRPQTAPRPSAGALSAKPPARYASPAPANFGQSVRGTQDSRDPAKKAAYGSKNGFGKSLGPRTTSAMGSNRSTSAFGNKSIDFSEDEDEHTPIRGPGRTGTAGSINSISSFNSKIRPASRANDRANEEELDRLRGQLEERDRQLKEQSSSLAEMENSLMEVQALMTNSDRHVRKSLEDKDAPQLRGLLREKNEKIAMLTAEFDAHRADFRSTIDTLEMASTETERVYEQRVNELLMDVRELQDRSEDVDSVAAQLKQLEELVQELEEGLEDARRGEAEARGEVEFLRGEVERTRSELRREKEKGGGHGSTPVSSPALAKELAQRDDEIRGLKAIIHSLSRDAAPEGDFQKTPTQRQGSFAQLQRPSNSPDLAEGLKARERLQKEAADVRAAAVLRTNREDELERESERMRRNDASLNAPSHRVSGSSGSTAHDVNSTRDSKGTAQSWREQRLEKTAEIPESDAYSSANESFCELCETSGHDILTCTNMFSANGAKDPPSRSVSATLSQRKGTHATREGLSEKSVPYNEYKPAPLSPIKAKPSPPPVHIIPNPMEGGPVAGKESGVINLDKWCGVCEREGHDSIDCPFEDAF